MGKLRGPKHRMCRRAGERLCSTEKCPAIRRQSPPGVHGPKGHPRLTEFGAQLREKQKAKYVYGVMERQFQRYYQNALRQTGNTAENFLRSLERRLDNVVFRLGLAKTRAAARQLITHGWVEVNGKRVDIPSYLVSAGDVISAKAAAKTASIGRGMMTSSNATLPSWLSADPGALSGTVVHLPAKEDFPPHLNMTLVVEFYSR